MALGLFKDTGLSKRKIDSMDNHAIYDGEKGNIEIIKKNFNYLNLSDRDFLDIVYQVINKTRVTYTDENKYSYSRFLDREIKKTLSNMVANLLSNTDTAFKLVSRYISTKVGSDPITLKFAEDFISRKLSLFFETYEFTPSKNLWDELINKNALFEKMIGLIVTEIDENPEYTLKDNPIINSVTDIYRNKQKKETRVKTSKKQVSTKPKHGGPKAKPILELLECSREELLEILKDERISKDDINLLKKRDGDNFDLELPNKLDKKSGERSKFAYLLTRLRSILHEYRISKENVTNRTENTSHDELVTQPALDSTKVSKQVESNTIKRRGGPKPKPILELLKCSREELLEILKDERITEDDINLLKKRDGDNFDLELPNKLDEELAEPNKFTYLVTKLRRILNEYRENKKNGVHTIEVASSNEQTTHKRHGGPKPKPILELLKCSREELLEILKDEKITEDDINLLKKRDGDNFDLEIPNKLDEELDEPNKFTYLLTRLRRILNEYREKKKNKVHTTEGESQDETVLDSTEQSEKASDEADILPDAPTTKIKEYYVQVSDFLKKSIFTQMADVLTSKERVIIALMFGSVDEKHFTLDAIAKFLGTEEAEIKEIAWNALKRYQEHLKIQSELLDNALVEEIFVKYTDGNEDSSSPISK